MKDLNIKTELFDVIESDGARVLLKPRTEMVEMPRIQLDIEGWIFIVDKHDNILFEVDAQKSQEIIRVYTLLNEGER